MKPIKDLTCRKILPLLLILQINFDKYFDKGLCVYINRLYFYDIITFKEKKLLLALLEKNKPKNKRYTSFGNVSAYYWVIGNRAPRLRWIKRMIDKETKAL